MTTIVRTVDLFAGCGGLSLGFELFKGDLHFQIAMALDNDPSSVKCFNSNALHTTGNLATSRLCDLNWFAHPSEVLLYYLVHFALWSSDKQLLSELTSSEIRLDDFFTGLRVIDDNFNLQLAQLVASDEYKGLFSKVDTAIFSLAICKTFLGKLGFQSLRSTAITTNLLPWREEYLLMSSTKSVLKDNGLSLEEISASVAHTWDTEIEKLAEASTKKGRGQHVVVAERLQSLITFLKSPAGKKLGEIWLAWKAQRDSLRATYCLSVFSKLQTIYSENRRVHLILGGPPCKGFSRIGRAVIENLRDQGAHAWASKEYGDERNALMHKYVLFLEALQPDVFVFENVAHFESSLKTPKGCIDASELLEQAIEDLSANRVHYSIHSEIVRARHYAIPQDRERFIMIGINRISNAADKVSDFFNFAQYEDEVPLQIALQGLDEPGEFEFSNPSSCGTDHRVRAYTLTDSYQPASHRRFTDWIRQPSPQDNNTPLKVDAHVFRKLRKDDQLLLGRFAPGKRWMDYKIKRSTTIEETKAVLHELLRFIKNKTDAGLFSFSQTSLENLISRIDNGLLLRLMMEDLALSEPHHLLSSGYLAKGTDHHGDWFERLSADRPSKTIVAHIGKDTYGYFHPYQSRAITIREAARVQSFPDFFNFGSVGVVDGYSMIGNAVPPLLANQFASQLDNLHAKNTIFGMSKLTDFTYGRKQERIKSSPSQLNLIWE